MVSPLRTKIWLRVCRIIAQACFAFLHIFSGIITAAPKLRVLEICQRKFRVRTVLCPLSFKRANSDFFLQPPVQVDAVIFQRYRHGNTQLAWI